MKKLKDEGYAVWHPDGWIVTRPCGLKFAAWMHAKRTMRQTVEELKADGYRCLRTVATATPAKKARGR